MCGWRGGCYNVFLYTLPRFNTTGLFTPFGMSIRFEKFANFDNFQLNRNGRKSQIKFDCFWLASGDDLYRSQDNYYPLTFVRKAMRISIISCSNVIHYHYNNEGRRISQRVPPVQNPHWWLVNLPENENEKIRESSRSCRSRILKIYSSTPRRHSSFVPIYHTRRWWKTHKIVPKQYGYFITDIKESILLNSL